MFCRLGMFFIVFFLPLTSAFAGDKSQDYYRNFWSPNYHALRLNYCSFDGKRCGMAVANQYCQLMGYEKADKEIIAHNVGLTHFISSKGRCKGWQCDGFKLIRCVGNISHKPPKIYSYRYRQYFYPRFNQYRIDWCYKDKKYCGQRAANSFCRRMGYLKTSEFKKAENVAATKTLGDEKLCFGKQCSGFSQITCYR